MDFEEMQRKIWREEEAHLTRVEATTIALVLIVAAAVGCLAAALLIMVLA